MGKWLRLSDHKGTTPLNFENVDYNFILASPSMSRMIMVYLSAGPSLLIFT